MERKKARYKGPTIDLNKKERLISKKTYIFVSNEEEVKKSEHEVPTYEKDDLQQSCLFDPAFTVDSSSNSEESCSSNEWVNCEDDVDEIAGEKIQPTGIPVNQNREFILTDFVPTQKNAMHDEGPGRGSSQWRHSSNTLLNESKDFYSKSKSEEIEQTNKPILPSGDNNHYVKNPFVNKVQVYKRRTEPHFDEKVMKGNPQTLLSNISKLYIGGYSELTSVSGYISESETSVYSEDSTKRAIKSILKREGRNQIGDTTKKKVRFDLNHRSFDDVSCDISEFTLDENVKTTDEKLDNNIKTETKPTELNDHYKYSVDSTKEQVEKKIEIFKKEGNCQNYFTSEEYFSGFENDDMTATQDSKQVSYDLLAIEELVEGNSDLQNTNSELLNTKERNNKVSEEQVSLESENVNTQLNGTISFTSIGVQSDQFETDSDSVTNSKYNNVSDNNKITLDTERLNNSELELKKIHSESQPLISEGEYSSFIKDLVSGSGDKLAKFLMSLSSEISSKSGEEKITNAMMTVGFFQQKNGSHDLLNTTLRKRSNDNVKAQYNSVNSNNLEKDVGYVKNMNSNGFNTSKKNERNLLINNRRSMSEINIHELKRKKPYCNTYMEKKIHSSRVDQLYINKTDNNCMWHNLPKNNANINGEVMGRLYEIVAELKQNVEKICRKESTIRIENAQIWLKDKSADGSRKAIFTEKTKETYSQTIETIGVNVGDHFQKQSSGKTEILIVSNSKNEEINIKVNDKNPKNRFMISSCELPEKSKTNIELNEIEERKQFFEENKHVPFNIVFNERTHLPTLKKGKYEVEIFEKMEGQVIDDTNFKNFVRKLTGNLNVNKLNNLQNFDKPQNVVRSSRSTKSNSSSSSKKEKSEPNLITSFLNKLLKLRIHAPVNKSNRKFVSSQNWTDNDGVNVLKYFTSEKNKKKTIDPINDGFAGSDNIDSFNVEYTSSNCIECDREYMNMYESDSWPDVIKTRYPNGMIHFGPLTLMPEPTSGNYERQGVESETCSCSKSRSCRQYVYNKHMKHMVKASMSRNQEPQGELSLQEFSETEQEFYHQWSQMGKA